ncbi:MULTISPECIES: hypothetical protein [unclassified Arthrobacter]|uniref:hypothetical protein n=1 Tax=unclassified Arthrobacter TaxID=235627 RepID=UPI0004639077|nr:MULTISPECIES: hypothetical protein [unclassified Arthrobacter]
MAALATIERVAARVGEGVITEPELIALAEEMLDAASAQVRHYGGQAWPDPATAPAVAVTITVAAAARGYMNPAGLDQERGDAVNFNRGDSFVEGVALTKAEQDMLAPYRPRTGLVSVGMVNTDAIVPRSHSAAIRDRGYVPFDWGEKPFPRGW